MFGQKELTEGLLSPDLDLCVFPPRYFYDKIHDALVGRVRIKGDIVPKGDGLAVFLQPHSPVLLSALVLCGPLR